MKICLCCRIEKPFSQFIKAKSRCRDCLNQEKREIRRQLRANPVPVPESKTCPNCKLTKSGADFPRDPGGPSGVGSWCKTCVNRYYEIRCQADPVSYKMQMMLRSARYRAKDEGLPFDLTFEWLMQSFGSVTHCDVLGIEINWSKRGLGACHNSPTLDKLIPKLGYVRGNVALISHKANAMKNDASEDELLRFCHYHLDRLASLPAEYAV